MKLNQVIALESSLKPNSYKEVSELYKVVQKPVLFNGFSKSYRKINEQGEDFSPERQLVQQKVPDLLSKVKSALSEYFSITATKDYANMHAKADIRINDVVLLSNVPVPYLLFLEKQLKDIETFISSLPTLSEDEVWSEDKNNKVWVSDTVTTHRTKKVQRPIVKYDATEHHPAQTELISEDVLVGYWDTKKISGAISLAEKDNLLNKVRQLSLAVKLAREEANSATVEKIDASPVLDYIFA